MRQIGIIRAAWLVTGPAVAQTPAAGDAIQGEALYGRRCGACHSPDKNRIGPRHRGVFGRVAGSLPDYDYSDALRESAIVWGAETLDQWLANPQAFIPGQKMGFRLSNSGERADIVAYLKSLDGTDE